MKITDILTADAILIDVPCSNKATVLGEVSRCAATLTGLDHAFIHKALIAREELGSTGVGLGVALPHASMKNVSKITGVFLRLLRPVEFHSIDNEPVDLVFLLLGPEPRGPVYLQVLAAFSRALRDPGIRSRLRAATSAQDVLAIFSDAGISQSRQT